MDIQKMIIIYVLKIQMVLKIVNNINLHLNVNIVNKDIILMKPIHVNKVIKY